MNWWNRLQNAAPQVTARTRAIIFVLALLGKDSAHQIALALVWPGSEVWWQRLFTVCAGVAFCLRAGDRTPTDVISAVRGGSVLPQGEKS